MKCVLAFVLVAVLSVVYGERCQIASDCTLESCGNGAMVECNDEDLCTCRDATATTCHTEKDCDHHGPCHEHGHGHHASWHCFDGACRCI
ncbi:Hypothetical predicted protein [Mytilus galloprovincialis]|uniref:Uncharacterized protein n=1 Tax=Mytilus galloprovincialis TaxID=29158 RepID=A0A8B6CU33_MYTGA|nr:Hypothetical predicted protein [Mytilus galloprovincialis]